jgi:cation:H+ antiporter
LTILLLLFGLPVRKKRIDAGGHRIGRINRIEGATFLAIYVGYIAFLIAQAM